MFNELWERVGEAVGRRNFLGTAVSACSAIAMALFGLDEVVMAGGGSGCCALISQTVCSDFSHCVAKWCWTCPKGSGTFCRIWKCWDCYNVPDACDGNVCDTRPPCHAPNSACICSLGQNTGLPCD
jgi:hypothetical protein